MRSINQWLAIHITKAVGTMTCAWLFAALALVSLPGAIATHSLVVIVAWIAQTFLQLVLLSILAVGQQVHADKTVARIDHHETKMANHFEALHRHIDRQH